MVESLKPAAVSVSAAAYVGIGKTKFYEEVNAGRIRTFVVGTRRLVAVTDLDASIEGCRAVAAAHGTPAA